MYEALIIYFSAERAGGQILAVAGVVFLMVSFALWARGREWKWGALPLGLVACIEIAVGASVALQTDGRVEALVDELVNDPADMRRSELERMAGVLDTFALLQTAETILAAIGALVLVAGLVRGVRKPWIAVGAALMLQATFALGFDGAAAERAERYRDALEAFDPHALPEVDGPSTE